MSDARLEKGARKLLAKDGGVVRRSLPNGREVDVAFVRTGKKKRTPVVIVPGRPGWASVLPYQGFRKLAAKRGVGCHHGGTSRGGAFAGGYRG